MTSLYLLLVQEENFLLVQEEDLQGVPDELQSHQSRIRVKTYEIRSLDDYEFKTNPCNTESIDSKYFGRGHEPETPSEKKRFFIKKLSAQKMEMCIHKQHADYQLFHAANLIEQVGC